MIEPYNMLMGLHFFTFEKRCLVISLLDQLKVGKFLVKISKEEDPSGSAYSIGRELLRGIATEAIMTYKNFDGEEESAGQSTAMFSEGCLQRMALWMISDVALKLSDTKSNEHPPASQWVNGMLEDLGTMEGYAPQYPATHPPFVATLKRFKIALTLLKAGKYDFDLPAIDSRGLKEIEKAYQRYPEAWPDCQVALCKYKHAYFKEVFPQGCPVCSGPVKTENEKFREAGKNLHEGEFLKKMKKMGIEDA